MNQPKISYLRNDRGQLEIDICAISSWEGFDNLIFFIKKEYNAVSLNEFDGPDARRWILESNGHQFELIHDDMFGNYLVAPTKDSEAIVMKIGEDLQERLKDGS